MPAASFSIRHNHLLISFITPLKFLSPSRLSAIFGIVFLSQCSLVTVPVETAGSIVTTTVKTTGKVLTAPFGGKDEKEGKDKEKGDDKEEQAKTGNEGEKAKPEE